MFFNKIHIHVLTVLVVVFVLLQIFISFFSDETFLSVFGFIHLFTLLAFVMSVLFCVKISKESVILYIYIYQLYLVIFHYMFYVSYYGNPFGARFRDALLYHNLTLDLQSMNFIESVKHIIVVQGIDDLGFPILMKYVYMFWGNEILNMKFVNIILHIIACYYLYKLTRLLIQDKNLCKLILILYGLNPITVYFNASGLKEPAFTLLVVLSFYFIYRAYLRKDYKYYVLGILAIVSTAFFRIPYPFIIIFSFAVLFYLSSSGKYKLINKLAVFILTPILFLIVLFFIKDELIRILLVNRFDTVAYRIGRVPNILDYLILLISGVIGPIPQLTYGMQNENYLLQSVSNFIKIIFSFFFIIGYYKIFKKKLRKFYPIIIFITVNILMFTIAGATLDHRLHFPFIPLYFVVMGYGYYSLRNSNFIPVKYMPYIFFVVILILVYNLR